MTKTNERIFTNRRYLDAVEDHVVIFDGAMGTSIQKYNLTAEDFGGPQYEGCNDYLVITRPDVIEAIHTSFLAVGSEAVRVGRGPMFAVITSIPPVLDCDTEPLGERLRCRLLVGARR